METKKDTRYFLTDLHRGLAQTTEEYNYLQREIQSNGFCRLTSTKVGTSKVYTAGLAFIFWADKLVVTNMDTQTETTLNGGDYIDTYIEGFKEGEQYFERELKVLEDTLHWESGKRYVKKLHANFYHVRHNGIDEGWGYVKKYYPTILTHKIVKEYGYYSGIVSKVEELGETNPDLFADFNKCDQNPPPQQTETKTECETVELKPVLKPEAVQIIFNILKDFFSPEHQTEFKKAIETGNNASTKLLFKGSGNRLTDTFKKLIEHDFITGCQKKDLINWITSNFTFTQQNKVKEFTEDTVEKTVSRNSQPCKSPLIEIKNGQIQKVEQPRRRKQSKS